MIRSPPGFRVRCRLVHTEGREALAAGLAHVIFLARAFSATNSVAGKQSVRRSPLPYQDALVVRCWPTEQRTGVCGSELECPGTHPRPLGGLGWAAVLASPHLQFPRGGFVVHPLATDKRPLSKGILLKRYDENGIALYDGDLRQVLTTLLMPPVCKPRCRAWRHADLAPSGIQSVVGLATKLVRPANHKQVARQEHRAPVPPEPFGHSS